jgi:hypothetical protein
MVVTFIFYLLFKIGLFFYRKIKILKNSSIIPLYKYTLKRLRSIKIFKPEHMGHLEFVKTLQKETLQELLQPIVESYYLEYYGNQKTTVIKPKIFFTELEELLKETDNKFIYLFKKFII